MAESCPRKTRERKLSLLLPLTACLLLAGMVWVGFKTTEVQRDDNLLIAALQSPNPVLLRAALDQGADPNALLPPVPSPGRFGMAPQWLDLLLHPHRGRPVLMDAIYKGNLQCVPLLLSRGASPNSRDNQGDTPLMAAVCQGNLQCIQLLLSRGALPNSRDMAGETPLMMATADDDHFPQRQIQIMQMLLSKGADVNAVDFEGGTVLSHAVKYTTLDGRIDLTIPRFLLTHGAKADVGEQPFTGGTLLVWCVKSRNSNSVPLMNLLLEHGANPNQTDGTSWTILQRASQSITPAIVKSLLDHGANPNGQSSTYYMTPLMEAVDQEQIGTIKLLLAKGADVNGDGSAGTVLSIAARHNRDDIVKLLGQAAKPK
jgi:ankyrin repeat protein